MSRNVIITCALTGSEATAHKNPHVPVTPAQIAAAAIEAAQEGAAMVHIHVRDEQSGLEAWRPELFREVVERIRSRNSELILNLTTGFGASMRPPEHAGLTDLSGFLADQMERFAHVQELLPEICSLDCGTMNFGTQHLFVNTTHWLTQGAQLLQQINVKPELEVFELGHVRFASYLVEKGYISHPPLFQLCLGVPWGAPATTETMVAMRQALPPRAVWSAFGIGATQLPMAVQAAILGGHSRVGLEDNLYLKKGVLASNGALVAKLVEALSPLDMRPATPAEARRELGLVARSLSKEGALSGAA
jgi:3-dehydrocarnitine:acetyl-CoA trimethylamine transferase